MAQKAGARPIRSGGEPGKTPENPAEMSGNGGFFGLEPIRYEHLFFIVASFKNFYKVFPGEFSEHFGLLLFGFKNLNDFILDGYLFAFQDSLLHQASQDISDRLQIVASQNDLFSKI